MTYIWFQDCHYWFSAALLDRFSWWKLLARVGLVRFGEDDGEEKMWQSKYFPPGRNAHGSEKLKYIKQLCYVMTTSLVSLLLITKVMVLVRLNMSRWKCYIPWSLFQFFELENFFILWNHYRANIFHYY